MAQVEIEELEVISLHGDPAVAEVAVGRFRGDNRYLVEVVDGLAPPIPREHKWIINVSTQFGCPVGCPFCDAAADFAGNLTAREILAQVRWGLDRHRNAVQECQKLKVHFARMGEPSLNDQVLAALKMLPDAVDCHELWACTATVAPTGREKWFEKLLTIKNQHYPGRFQLQFSVQSTDEYYREMLIPAPHWSLEQIAEYGTRFHEANDRKVLLNFALVENTPFAPEIICRIFDPTHFAVKLTPLNPTAAGLEKGFRTVLRSQRAPEVMRAVDSLSGKGFDVILSIGDGREDDIGSNCGQAVRVFHQ